MIRILLLAATFASLAASVAAQTASAPSPELVPRSAPAPELVPGTAPAPELIPGAAPPDAPRQGRGPRGEGRRPAHLFISPSGEPFRGGDGLAAWFAEADLDHDGAITAKEFEVDALRVFQRLDTNGDGVLDGFEIQAYEQEVPEIGQIMVEEGGRGGRRRGHGRGPQLADASATPRQPSAGAQGAARFSLLNEPEPVLAADENVTGRVTREQWLRATARRFAKLDKSGTGRLTLEELRPKPQKR